MRADAEPFEVMHHSFPIRGAETDAVMRRIAECVADLRPAIRAAAERHGERRAMWAMLAILVHMAVERRDGRATAAMMRSNARIIELETDTADPPCGGRPRAGGEK